MTEDKYVCSFCGAEHDSAPARARCELECDEKRKAEAERERRRQLEAERQVRLQEIRQARDTYNALVEQFNKDYPSTTFIDDMLWSDFPFMCFGRRGIR